MRAKKDEYVKKTYQKYLYSISDSTSQNNGLIVAALNQIGEDLVTLAPEHCEIGSNWYQWMLQRIFEFMETRLKIGSNDTDQLHQLLSILQKSEWILMELNEHLLWIGTNYNGLDKVLKMMRDQVLQSSPIQIPSKQLRLLFDNYFKKYLWEERGDVTTILCIFKYSAIYNVFDSPTIFEMLVSKYTFTFHSKIKESQFDERENIILGWDKYSAVIQELPHYELEAARLEFLNLAIMYQPINFMKSVAKYKLTDSDVWNLWQFILEKKIDSELIETFLQERNLLVSDDFDSLLKKAHDMCISKSFKDTRNLRDSTAWEKLVAPYLDNYKSSLKKPELHYSKLIKYLDKEFKSNFDAYQNGTICLNHESMEWCQAAASYIQYFLPSENLFMEGWYIPHLFGRLVKMNTEYPKFYESGCCIEKLFLQNMLATVKPYSKPISRMISCSKELNNNQPKLINTNIDFRLLLFKNKALQSRLMKNRRLDKMPNLENVNQQWQRIKRIFSHQNKKLFDVYDYHILELSSPLKSCEGMEVTLVLGLTTASIIYLFNSETEFTKEIILKKLNCDSNNMRQTIEISLNKLVRLNLLILDQDTYAFNFSLKPKKSILRCL